MRILAILPVKGEDAFLIEWMARARAVGFTDILALSNDCSDGTDVMLDRLQVLGWCEHLRNDGEAARGLQWAALKATERPPLRIASDWVMVTDVDEFVNIHVGDRTIPALLAALPRATAAVLTRRLFGNAGIVGFEDRPLHSSSPARRPRCCTGRGGRSRSTCCFAKTGVLRAADALPARAPADARRGTAHLAPPCACGRAGR